MRQSPPFIPITEKQVYAGALALLLFIWFAITAAMVVLLVLVLFPNYPGFGDCLRTLHDLLPR